MFALAPRPDGHHVRFSATLLLLDRAVAVTVAFLREREAEGSLFDVKLLLREALLNAVVHGNRSDPTREVSLEVTAYAGRVDLCVTDQGPGFPWRERLRAVPAPEATSGRGLTILTLYADDVSFNPAGNQVRLSKRIPGLRGPAAPGRSDCGGEPSRRRS